MSDSCQSSLAQMGAGNCLFCLGLLWRDPNHRPIYTPEVQESLGFMSPGEGKGGSHHIDEVCEAQRG